MGRDEERPKSAQTRLGDPLRMTMEIQDVDGEERFMTIGSEKQHRMKGNSMKRLAKSERRKQIRRFDAIRDDQINTTKIPEITEEQMRKGVVGHLYRPIKRPVTMRLDADVIAWLKQGGPGYQTKANRLLRREMLKSRRA
jgi:uncharacterized protein (DUF4415 family)